MTPIYDALRAAPHRSTEANGTDTRSAPQAADRTAVRLTLVPIPAPAPATAPSTPATFPVRVLSTPRTPPWRADLLP